MTENPYEPGAPRIASDATECSTPRPGPLGSAWRATKRGLRTGAIVGAVISLPLLIIPALALAAFGLGSAQTWVLPRFFFSGIGFLLFCAVLGGLISAGFGLITGAIRKARQRGGVEVSSAAPERPVGFSPGPATSSIAGFTASPRRRRALWPWLVGVPMLMLLAASFGTGTYVGGAVERRRSAAIAAAGRDVPYWQLDDLLAHRAQVADEQNSAILMDEVLALLPQGWSGTKTKPPEGVPQNIRLSDSAAETLRAELKEIDNAVQLARRLEGCGQGRHELEIGPAVTDTPLPQTQDARIVTRLMEADATMRTHDGDLDGALASCRAISGAGRSIGDEPFLISQLVRFAIAAVASESIERAISQGEPSEAALARAQATVLDELDQPLLLLAMRGERAALTEMIRRVGDGEIPISALSESRALDPVVVRPADAPWTKLWFDFQYTVALEWTNDAVAIAQLPAAGQPARWVAWQANVKRVKESRLGIYTATLPLLLSPALAWGGSAASRNQGELGTLAILIAAERHRRKTGRWPESIEAIDRGILAKAPVDPYSGQPFRFQHRDGQLVIYSIGPDGKDEHGEFAPKQWLKGGPDDVGARGWDLNLRRRPAAPADK
jgi:hypothetical protein